MAEIEVPEEVKQRNRELCEKYPFLIPRNRWSGMRITEAQDGGFWPGDHDKIPEYDWEYTELDEMPDGWRLSPMVRQRLYGALVQRDPAEVRSAQRADMHPLREEGGVHLDRMDQPLVRRVRGGDS